ncbi:MAG TPA: DUF2142 domain-containing protein, partial [Mycobacteriales bacterium]|nr:DUF2142 domain-containing protein [Mycobacteriales bacterium]
MSGVGTVALRRARALGRRRRTTVGVGLAGVLLTFAVLATLQAFTIHPFHPPDEMSHVGYALEVTRGELPTVETPIPAGEIPLLDKRVANSRPANRTVWTANHPPLYYLAAAVPIRIGVALDRPLGGIRAARLLTIGISLVGLALVVLLARELVPARPELWVAAAGLAALLPVQVLTSAVVYNDALSFTLTAAVLLLVTRMLRWGPTPRRLVLVTVLAAAAALTRASGLVVVAVATAAVVAAVWRHADRPGRARVLRAAGAAAAVAVTALAAAGWFYLRNRQLYGSATGTGALLTKFSRHPHGTVPQSLLAPEFWQDQLRRLWDDSAGPSGRNGYTEWWYLTFVPLFGLVLAGVRWLRRAVPPPSGLVLCWLACLGVAGLVELSAASFYSLGGTAHGRYLLPALSVVAVAAAAGLAGLPGRRALPFLVAMPLLVAANVHVWWRYLDVTL